MNSILPKDNKKSMPKGRLAKPKWRNPLTGRFESKKIDPSNTNSDGLTFESNRSSPKVLESRKSNEKDRSSTPIKSGSFKNRGFENSSLQENYARITRSSKHSEIFTKDVSIQQSNFNNSTQTRVQKRKQQVEGLNSQVNVNAKRKLDKEEDDRFEDEELRKKMISVDDETVKSCMSTFNLEEVAHNLKIDLCAPENAEQTTENTQASNENHEDTSDGIIILSQIKICETCRNYIPWQDVRIGHTKECVKCLHNTIFSFHNLFAKFSEEEPENDIKIDEPELHISKFMSVSLEDQIQVGPNHQADIPMLRQKKIGEKCRNKNLKKVWDPSKIVYSKFTEFRDMLKSKNFCFTDEDVANILGQFNYNTTTAKNFCKRQNPEFNVFYRKSCAKRRMGIF